MKSRVFNSKAMQSFTRYFLLIALLLSFAVFGVLEPNYFSTDNIMNILRSVSVTSLMAFGMLLVVNTGEINFAIGAQLTLAGAIVGHMLDSRTFHNYFVAVLVAFIAIELSMVLILFLILYLRIPAFIATLGASAILDAAAKYLTGNVTLLSQLWPESFSFLGQTYIGGTVPLPFVIMTIFAILVYVFMEKTTIGRDMFCVGANITAANQMGINVKRMKIIAFLLCGFFVTLAGIIQASIANSIILSTGSSYLLPVISSSILGATFLKPGKYNVPGTLIASLFTVVVRIGVVSIGAGSFLTDVMQGIILIISVSMIANIRKEGLPSVSFG